MTEQTALESPWGPEQDKVDSGVTGEGSFQGSSSPTVTLGFEDHFVVRDTHDRLPDSDQYLASLEGKLKRLQGQHKVGSLQERRHLVDSLRQTHESYLLRLVTQGRDEDQNSRDPLDDLDAPLNPNVLLRKLAPERQAVNFEELVELLQADQLAKALEEEQQEEEDQETKKE